MSLTAREAGRLARELISAERERQVSAEGYSAAHDDAHADGSLLTAARIYLAFGEPGPAPVDAAGAPLDWPWEPESFKPRSRRENLIRAGALLKAEIDRRTRAGIITVPPAHKLMATMAELAFVLRLESAS